MLPMANQNRPAASFPSALRKVNGRPRGEPRCVRLVIAPVVAGYVNDCASHEPACQCRSQFHPLPPRFDWRGIKNLPDHRIGVLRRTTALAAGAEPILHCIIYAVSVLYSETKITITIVERHRLFLQRSHGDWGGETGEPGWRHQRTSPFKRRLRCCVLFVGRTSGSRTPN